MLRFVADENFNHAIVRGLLRRAHHLDIETVAGVGLRGASDPEVLSWAADHGRVLLTHDVATMPDFVRARVERGQPMPGVIEVAATAAIGRVIEDLLLLAECSADGEWERQIVRAPL